MIFPWTPRSTLYTSSHFVPMRIQSSFVVHVKIWSLLHSWNPINSIKRYYFMIIKIMLQTMVFNIFSLLILSNPLTRSILNMWKRIMRKKRFKISCGHGQQSKAMTTRSIKNWLLSIFGKANCSKIISDVHLWGNFFGQ
jgi:hypothetical protein